MSAARSGCAFAANRTGTAQTEDWHRDGVGATHGAESSAAACRPDLGVACVCRGGRGSVDCSWGSQWDDAGTTCSDFGTTSQRVPGPARVAWGTSVCGQWTFERVRDGGQRNLFCPPGSKQASADKADFDAQEDRTGCVLCLCPLLELDGDHLMALDGWHRELDPAAVHGKGEVSALGNSGDTLHRGGDPY